MGFAAIRDQQRRISASQIEEKPEPQYEKPKQHIEYQIQAPVQTFDENRKPNAENGKSAKRNKQQNRKTDVIWYKKTAKPQTLMPPSSSEGMLLKVIIRNVEWGTGNGEG